MQNLSQLIEQEKATLTKRRDELKEELQKIEQELAGVHAYEAAKLGKPAPTPRAPSTGRRSGIRNDVLTVIATSEEGMTRRELLEHFNAVDDKKAAQSISNALANLNKSAQITKSAQGLWIVPTDTTPPTN